MRTECGIAIFGTAAEGNGVRRTIREAKRMKSIRHGLVILTDASHCGDGGENANEKNNQGFGAERYMEAVRTLIQEYVFMAQKMQQPHPCDACCGSEGGDDDDGEDAVVDQDTTGVTETRLVLSINFVAPYNAKAIACQQVEMERPVAVTRRNQRLLQGISRRVDDCLSYLKGQPSYHDDVEVSSAALVRALEWFKDSSFTVSVIAPSDSIPLRQVPSLASALTKLREVQFVLLRSDDERAVQSSQNILRLLRAIKRSENPMCSIRQIENYALQLHGLTKEWIYRVAPSVSASVYYDGLPQSKGSPAALTIDIRSNYLLPSRGSQMLHAGMSRLEIMHIVPMSTVHPSILMGCPLHGCPSLAATMPVDVAKNLSKVKALAHFLETELCGAILRCKLQIQSEFYLMVPSRGESVNVQFLFFRVASAEEVLVPPPEYCQTKAPLAHTVEDRATFELLHQIPRREFNPFHYRSDAISASMIIRKTSSKAELHAQVSATASKPKVKKSKKGLSAEHSLKSYAPILTSKRKKLV